MNPPSPTPETETVGAAAAPPTPSAARDLTWLLAGLGALSWTFAGLRPLSNPDEGRYVEIAREMVRSGDWISPRLNGVLYFEKPPLFYWLEAGAVSMGGTNLWTLRFWPIALALLGCAAVYVVGRAWWGRDAGWWSGWILGTGLLYYGIGQIIILDMAVSVFLTVALGAFGLAVRAPPGPGRRRWCAVLYAGMALALMTKGLIGVVIPCAVIFWWLLLLNRWRELRHAHLFSGLALVLALALPWHVAAALATPPPGGWDWAHFFSRDEQNQGFLWYYLIHEQALRYLDPHTAERVQPWWFFLAVLPAGFLPWTVFLPSALRASCAGGWARLKGEPEAALLLLWTLIPLAFFSASSSKLPTYILPSVPPLALLTGRFLAEAWREPSARALTWPLRVLGVLTLAAAVAAPLIAKRADWPGAVPWFDALGLLLLIGGATVLWLTAARAQPRRAAVIAGTVLGLFLLAFSPLASFVQRPSTRAAAAWLAPRLRPGDRVFTLWDYGPFQDFPAYLNQLVGVAGQVPAEQQFGAMLETATLAGRYPGLPAYLDLTRQPHPDKDQLNDALLNPFIALLRQPARVYVLVDAAQFPVFANRYPTAPMQELWHDQHFLLFSNQPGAPP